MYSDTYSHISLVTTRMFHPLTNCKIMRLRIELHKILGSIKKSQLNLNELIFFKSHVLNKLFIFIKII
jgi:hypothetical protein